MILENIFLGILLFFIGASIGSFAYAFALRFPKKKPWVLSRSKCDSCGRLLKWQELVPIISFLFQSGKCRNCHKFIGWNHLWPEALMGISFLQLGGFLFPNPYYGEHLFWWGSFLILFLIIALIDLKYFIIPDKLIMLGGALALFYKFSFEGGLIFSSLIMGGVLGLVFFTLWFVSKGEWLGLGDVKLLALIGFLFGFPASLWILLISVFSGTFLGIFLIMLGRASRKTALPFGLFLGIASIIYILFPGYLDAFFFNVLL